MGTSIPWLRILILLIPVASLPVNAQTFVHTFEHDEEGWVADFADYPTGGQEAFYELEAGHTALPPNIVPLQHGIRIQGNNHSDDLFMFLRKRITGLTPFTTYELTFDLAVASRARTNATGIGGAPGEGVVFHAGATLIEPMKVDSGAHYRMNIDKGDQSRPGADSDTLGHIGASDTATAFAIIHRDNHTHPFRIATDASGEVWVHVGTDSGFEGLTVLYYDTITLTFTATTGIPEPMPGGNGVRWAMDDGVLRVRTAMPFRHVELLDALGRRLAMRTGGGTAVDFALPAPRALLLMVLEMEDGRRTAHRIPPM